MEGDIANNDGNIEEEILANGMLSQSEGNGNSRKSHDLGEANSEVSNDAQKFEKSANIYVGKWDKIKEKMVEFNGA